MRQSGMLWVQMAGLLLIGLILIAACNGQEEKARSQVSETEDIAMGIIVSSTAFNDGDSIPGRYACDGEDVSPPLNWKSIPENTVSLALIMDDPDAPGGTWVHWVVYDIPPDISGLPEDVPVDGPVPSGGSQGLNSWGNMGYGGPCPPGGSHRYLFKLYALDTELGLGAETNKEQLLKAMQGHIIDAGQLLGNYSR